MNITGISYKFIMFSPTIDQVIDADIQFTGDNLEITENTRFSNDVSIKHFKLTQETINFFRSLIEKYKITEWIGKTPSAPVIYNDDHTHVITFLTLKFDDGTSSEITFREGTEDIYKEAADEFRKAFFTATSKETLISEEKKYPNLKEARLIKEEHGPVTAVETHHFSSGMMYNSNVTTKQKISKIPGKDGTVLVELYRKAGNLPEQTDSKEVESNIFAKIQEISDKELYPRSGVKKGYPINRAPVDVLRMYSTGYAAGSMHATDVRDGRVAMSTKKYKLQPYMMMAGRLWTTWCYRQQHTTEVRRAARFGWNFYLNKNTNAILTEAEEFKDLNESDAKAGLKLLNNVFAYEFMRGWVDGFSDSFYSRNSISAAE